MAIGWKFWKGKPEPKIQIRHRVRKNGWIKCECSICECSELSRWEDNLCIKCWNNFHRKRYKQSEVK
jgi:hypothetical protein